MNPQELRDSHGHILGRITTEGRMQVLYDAHGHRLGNFDGNSTFDAHGHRIGSGNLLATLLVEKR